MRPETVPVGPIARSSWRATVCRLLLVGAIVAPAACGESGSAIAVDGPAVPAVLSAQSFGSGGPCSAGFAAHDLDHVTAGPGNTSSTYDGTGAGLAAGDLDRDGDDDLVVANLSGATSIFENRSSVGDIRFDRHDLIVGRFRQAAIVDVDGDRELDIVLTTGVGPPTVFWNNGGDALVAGRFERDQLPGVVAATYAMAWGDLGGDGDLDLVTGSYNAELTELRNSPVMGSDTGVVVYERTASGRDAPFTATRIAAESQALAVRLFDADGDRSTDIWVGNDLATPDGLWLDNDGGWLAGDRLVGASSFSTMSLDAADVDNDGRLELFATDMAPMSQDPANLARYAEVTADMEAMPRPDDVQRPENVLLDFDGERYTDQAPARGVEATGWSWSGVFGDLDSDGALDLYVVNGMRSDLLFAALPDDTLSEPNQAFRNAGDRLVPAPEWGLADEAGGRGLVMADFDRDGDLDIGVNNLGAPTRIFENRLCGGTNLVVSLDWVDSGNVDAVGAVIEVSRGRQRLTRTIDTARGYLSSGPLRAHFGLGDNTATVDLVVLWPDGMRSSLTDVAVGRAVTISR